MDINLFGTEVKLNQDKEFVKSAHSKVFQSLHLLLLFFLIVFINATYPKKEIEERNDRVGVRRL